MALVPPVRYRTPVTTFIDLQGASGAVYRFRRTPPETLQAAAGNFVFAAADAPAGRIVCCGTTTNLATCAKAWADAAKQEGGVHLYVRLNVASRARAIEHEDLIGALNPPLIATDPD
jgi:hypothetical protein